MTYIQYGCGLSAPKEWTNYDASPTLRLQRLPLIGGIMPGVKFPKNIMYGDIVKGLPVPDNSADGLYCSHILEHLSLEDCRTALAHSYRILKPGGIFRSVVPDLELFSRIYLRDLDSGDDSASVLFVSMLGSKTRPKGLKGRLAAQFGNAKHLWMWDRKSLAAELRKTGFGQVRSCEFNDSADPMFKYVEDANRFVSAVALEAIKPR